MPFGHAGFRPLAFGDIPADTRRASDLARRVLDWRNGQRYIQPPAVFAHAHRLTARNSLSLAGIFQRMAQLLEVVRRSQDGNGLPNHFLSTITVQTLRSTVPTDNDPLQANADNGVLRGFHQGGQKRLRLFRLDAVRHVLAYPADDGFIRILPAQSVMVLDDFDLATGGREHHQTFGVTLLKDG